MVVTIEVIAGQVGPHRNVELESRQPILAEGMGGDLHRHRSSPSANALFDIGARSVASGVVRSLTISTPPGMRAPRVPIECEPVGEPGSGQG